MGNWQNEEHVDEPPQPDQQDPDATEDHDPATEDDDREAEAEAGVMAYTSTRTARNAEADEYNSVGYCLMQSRLWAGIDALYPDAATAWRNVDLEARNYGDRRPPRGAAVYWIGGSRGYGHIAISLGKGRIRSTDAGGAGRVATRTLGWFDRQWPSLTYMGWSWDINEVTIPHRRERAA